VLARVVRFAMVIGGLLVTGVFLVTPDGTGLLQPIDGAFAPTRVVSPTWRLIIVFGSLAACAGMALIGTLELAVDHRRRAPRVLLAAAIAGVACRVVALVVQRPAPGAGSLTGAVSVDRSFPSLPTAIAAAVVLTLVRESRSANPRRQTMAFAVAAVAVLVIVRVVSGSAWLLDEAAGCILGVTAAGIASPAMRRRRPAIDPTRPRPTRWAVRISVAAVAVGVGVPAGIGYTGYLTAPGNATVAERSVEYLRDRGLGSFVDRAEAWWLWAHLPPSSGRLTALPDAPLVRGAGSGAPADLPPAITPVLSGEGRWAVAASDHSHRAQIATAVLRPDPNHPTLVAAVAWISQTTTRLQLIAGTREPGGGPGPAGATVPTAERPDVLAAFNSGYRMMDTPGGALVEGRQVRTMQPGLATVAIRPDGTARVGAWGTDLDPAAQYAGLRQNLYLMVDNGRVVDGVATNAGARWGTVANTLPTWRSGLGVTASGDLVYVAGNQLTLGVLADTLVRAGAVTAMELDIHNGMVTFNLFTHANGQLQGHKLLPNMPKSANRYLQPDWRDFFVVAPAP
jgi:hypothetical protein